MAKIIVVGLGASLLSVRTLSALEHLQSQGHEVVVTGLDGISMKERPVRFILDDVQPGFPSQINPKDYKKVLPDYRCIGRSGKHKNRGW